MRPARPHQLEVSRAALMYAGGLDNGVTLSTTNSAHWGDPLAAKDPRGTFQAFAAHAAPKLARIAATVPSRVLTHRGSFAVLTPDYFASVNDYYVHSYPSSFLALRHQSF